MRVFNRKSMLLCRRSRTIENRKSPSPWRAGPALLPLLLAALALSGCTSARQSTPNAEGPQGVFKPATEHDVSSREYIVDPPDELTIRSPNIKEMDNSKQVVRPDGKIALNLLGEVYVAGMTPEQINELLRKMAEKYYVNPDIKVEVDAKSKFYNVFGYGATSPGPKPYTGRNTVVSALAEAGFSQTAWPQQVYISRPGKNGQPNATAIVDFKKVWQTGDLTQNYLVEQNDIVYVPDSPLSEWNKNMTKVLGPITGSASAVSSGQSVARPNGN